MLNRRLTFRDVHFETGPGIVFTAYRFAGDVAHDGVFQKKQTLETPTGVFPCYQRRQLLLGSDMEKWILRKFTSRPSTTWSQIDRTNRRLLAPSPKLKLAAKCFRPDQLRSIRHLSGQVLCQDSAQRQRQLSCFPSPSALQLGKRCCGECTARLFPFH